MHPKTGTLINVMFSPKKKCVHVWESRLQYNISFGLKPISLGGLTGQV